jgi:hypothetical protein
VDDIRDDSTRFDSRSGPPKLNRRLSDKILIAFHQACDQNEALVALQLLAIHELMLTRRPRKVEFNRRSLETIVAAHERLWHIRYSENLSRGVDAVPASCDCEDIHSD